MIYVPELQGSLQTEVVSAARQFELLPVPLDGEIESLLREVAAGNPVFVLQNLGLDAIPVWHYEVVVGYDFDERVMILRSGVNRRVLRPFAVFERTWRRAGYWGLAIVATNSIPVTADQDAYLDTVIALEQVGRVNSANLAYSTAVKRWPESLLAHSGIGNTAYALGDFVAAAQAYHAALAIDSGKAEVWNNLAYALAQLGRHESSMEAIRRALDLDPDNQNFRDSFNELKFW